MTVYLLRHSYDLSPCLFPNDITPGPSPLGEARWGL